MKIDGKTDGRIAEILTKVKSTNKLLGTYAFVVHCKGLAQVIQVLPLLQDYAFAVIGEGPEINMLKEQRLRHLELRTECIFFPYQEFPCNYLHYFDIYMMPSYSEGFGMAMVEAALGGKAIVCSDIPVFHEIFNENEVRFFTLDNTDSLQQAIESAYSRKKSS